MSHLDILLPFGLPPQELAADLVRALKTPSLSTLISRARAQGGIPGDETTNAFARALPHEAWLARQFGLESRMAAGGSPPVAAAAMTSLGLTFEPGFWFIVNPVHIHIARDHLVLTDPRQLDLSEQESRALFDVAHPLFEEAGKILRYGTANTWFARADEWDQLQTSSPDAAGGHNIDIWMPKGSGERNWRKLQNEVQMHWFSHPVNAERDARHQRPVNSIWIWGGTQSPLDSPAPAYTDVYVPDGWMRAFGQFAERQARAVTGPDVLAQPTERGLVILDSLIGHALGDDWAGWLDKLNAIESDWLAPLVAGLRSGKIDRLSLILTHHARISSFAVTRHSLRKFWIQPSLAPLFA